MTRTISLYFTIVFAVLMAGCKTDPAVLPASLQNPALNGKWLLKSVVVETQVTNADEDIPPITYNSFTTNDFFEFKANNAAVYSSSLIGKSYTGYFSTRMETSPQSLTFKSTNFSVNFYIQTINANKLVLYQTRSVTENDVTTTVINTYTYSH
jgi:hypothetical protein